MAFRSLGDIKAQMGLEDKGFFFLGHMGLGLLFTLLFP